MKHLSFYIKHPRFIGLALLYRFGSCLPDVTYLRLQFYFEMGKVLNLENPKTFSEKLQWLKLYNRKPEYTIMVDKYRVKDYVAKIIGKDYIIPTLGVWENPEDIEWDKLPLQFVLKTTNGGGSKGVVICKDKNALNKSAIIAQLNKAKRRNIYKKFREWPYKDVPLKIIAEKFIEDARLDDLRDYKFFCFNGRPVYCQVISGRAKEMTIDFFDMNWNHMSFHEPKKYPFAKKIPTKPENYVMMQELASALSTGQPFLRVDFYEVNSKVYFGELTFFPTSGFGGFDPVEWDEILGSYIQI